MSPDFGPIVTTVHFLSLAGISLYGLHRIRLLLSWRLLRNRERGEPPPLPETLPRVTVQLPVFNERFVAGRLLDSVAALDWPKDRLEIQVLDDSSDDTTAIVAERVAFWRGEGIDIRHLHRRSRDGYKAGALALGLDSATGEFISVFDADFTPPADFLRKSIPHFADQRVGMVQCRWGFRNADHSLLTAVQALLLGHHFRIEHEVRFRMGLFFNFNGTAGTWRRAAIEQAGGWQSDTVTEDLDLSYRAQLAGWRFVYLDGEEVPSELPVTLASFRTQQQRWAKGSVQTARKILPGLLSLRLPAEVRLEGVAHLLANLCWLLGTVAFLTLYPTVLSRIGIGPWQMIRLDLPFFLLSTGAILAYFAVYRSFFGGLSLRDLFLLPIIGIALAPSISLAVFAGLRQKGGFFDRTPKFGIAGKSLLPAQAFLYRRKGAWYLLLNSLLLGYSLLPLRFAWERGTWYAVPLFLLFPAGFLLAVFHDVKELLPEGGFLREHRTAGFGEEQPEKS